jgi:hypothetical protein
MAEQTITTTAVGRESDQPDEVTLTFFSPGLSTRT